MKVLKVMLKQKTNIIECFTSLEGEGRYQGELTFFIRFSGCNLNCKWCDTKYSHKRKTMYSVDEVLRRLKESPAQRVTITGGEPLEESNRKYTNKLLNKISIPITIETNGSISIFQGLVNCRGRFIEYAIDWKTPSSGEEKSFNKKNLTLLNYKNVWIKFPIIDIETDLPFAISKLGDIPEWIDVYFQTTRLNNEVANAIIQNGLRVKYGYQLHKELNIQ